jgi:hypothetical protein
VAIFDLKTQDSVEVWVEKDGYSTEIFEIDLLSGENNETIYLKKNNEDAGPQSKGEIEVPDFSVKEEENAIEDESELVATFSGETAISLVQNWLTNKSSIYTDPYEISDHFFEFITRDGGLADCLRRVVIPALTRGNRDYAFTNHQFLEAVPGQLYSGLVLRPAESPNEAVVLVHIRETKTIRERGRENIVAQSDPYNLFFRYWFAYDNESSSWKIDDYCQLDEVGNCTDVIKECPIRNR